MTVWVDWRGSLALVGTVLRWLALAPAIPLVAAVVYGEPVTPYLLTAGGTFGVSLLLRRGGPPDAQAFGPREAYLSVSLIWLAVAVVGAIPFLLAGVGPIARPSHALFEAMSGVTTTGATVITDFAAQPRSLFVWRALLQWLGGLGILALATAVLARLSVGGAQLMETESQLEDVQKLTPSLTDTARIIWGLYLALTVATVLVLLGLRVTGLAPDMTVYAAVTHAFTSISTSGFSPRPDSIGAFGPAVQWSLIGVMAVGATNFVLLYRLVQGDLGRLRQSEEFRFYLGLLGGAALLVFGLLVVTPGVGGFNEATLRAAAFQTTSILTTTGYATVDYNAWPASAKHILFILMFLGGMAGSTTCSVKTVRWLVVVKAFRRDLYTAVTPQAVRPVRLSGAVVPESAVRDIYAYTLTILIGFFLATVFLVVDAARTGMTLSEFEAMGAAASTFLNIGPAFGIAGPFDSYAPFSRTSLVVMTLLMWVGRLEIIPVLVLVTPSFWQS